MKYGAVQKFSLVFSFFLFLLAFDLLLKSTGKLCLDTNICIKYILQSLIANLCPNVLNYLLGAFMQQCRSPSIHFPFLLG